MKQGRWNCVHRPTALNPIGWATVAELALGEHAPIKLPDDARPRPHVRLEAIADDRRVGFVIVDPGHEQDDKVWDTASPKRIRGVAVEAHVLGPGERDGTRLVLVRRVDLNDEGEFQFLDDVPSIETARDWLTKKNDQAVPADPVTDVQSDSPPFSPAGPVHVVGTYSGADGAPLTVGVGPSDEPITLVLTAYYWQDLRLELAEGAELERVIVAGYNGQHVDNLLGQLPEGVPLHVYTYFPTRNAPADPPRPEGIGERDSFWAYKETSEEYHELRDKLGLLIGEETPVTFTGAYQAESFVVGE